MWHFSMHRAKGEPGGGEEGAGRALPTGEKSALLTLKAVLNIFLIKIKEGLMTTCQIGFP